MNFDRNSHAARMGALAEYEAARILQSRGHAVLPVFSALHNSGSVQAPMIYAPLDGLAIGPDILCFHANGAVWIDVKGKAIPTWRRTAPGPQWEHGIDFAAFCDYERVASFTRFPVWLLLREESTPADPAHESPLGPEGSWLAISLRDARTTGDHRPDWPGGRACPNRRGRKGAGGFLWPRSAMRPWLLVSPPTVTLTGPP